LEQQPVGHDNHICIGELLIDEFEGSPQKLVDQDLLKRDVRAALGTLPERLRQIEPDALYQLYVSETEQQQSSYPET
jgi:hypothetical protein